MYINVFLNAEILEKIKPSSIHWISPYIKPGSKKLLCWDKCRGLNFALEVGLFYVLSLVTLQKIGVEQLATICTTFFFAKAHRKSQDNNFE